MSPDVFTMSHDQVTVSHDQVTESHDQVTESHDQLTTLVANTGLGGSYIVTNSVYIY